MVKKEVKRLWSKHNVPLEIWWEILTRLPVRSLVRFRCVSSSWKTVIDDPDFCRDHLVRFKNNSDETHLLTVQGGMQCFVQHSDTMKTSMSFGSLLSREKKNRDANGLWRICFSVDGLVMLKCYLHDRDNLMLWNPSIRKCQLVPYSQGACFLELGLGFDPTIRDYKLVRVGRKTPSSVEIYTVGTSSLKTVAAQGALPSTWPKDAVENQSIYFKGCLYMLSSTKLISFDLSKEVFKSVDLPEYNNSAHFSTPLALVEMWSSLAVLNFSSHVVSVWVLDDNPAASSWIMRCTFALRVPHFLYLKKNGDLLFNRCVGMKSYNIHTGEEKLLGFFPTLWILGYKESLVLLK